MIDPQHHRTVQTTGYIWDGDIQEFNNLLPKIWLGGFYATIVFAICCWVFYPTWPFGSDYTKGYLNRISYQSRGTIIRTHWNSRALLLHTLQKKDSMETRNIYLQRLASASFQDIVTDSRLIDFSHSLARIIFSDSCVPCHGGNAGIFTRLSTEKKAWSGTFEQIEQAIIHGHQTPEETSLNIIHWPSWQSRLSTPEIKALSIYVQQLPIQNIEYHRPKDPID